MKETTEIQMDTVSKQWLVIAGSKDAAGKPVFSIPEKYFEILKTWGMLEGTSGAATLTPKARGHLLKEKTEAKQAKRRKK